MEYHTIIEPFRIKSVEPLALPSPAQRKRFLEESFYNPIQLK